MLEKIVNLLAKLRIDIMLFACIGILLVAFIVGVAVSVMSGDHNKFKKVATQALKNPDMANFNATVKQMPVKVKKQYKAFKKSGAKAGDVITIDACVYGPYSVSGASRFGNVMSMFAIVLPILAFAWGNMLAFVGGNKATIEGAYAITAVVAVLGIIFRLLAGVIAGKSLNSAIKVYNKYIDALEDASGHSATVDHDVPHHDAPVYENNATFEPHETEEPVIENGEPPVFEPVMDDEPPVFEPVMDDEPIVTAEPEQPAQDYNFNEPTRLDVELADEEPIVTAPPAEDAAAEKARARAEAMAAMKAEQQRIQLEAEAKQKAEADAKAKLEAEAKARAEARAKAEAELRARTAQAQTAQTAGGSSSADDVIARIEQINREGAPLATMKEVALALQQERAKPENKTPEQQRKLNEALASLLKAMSSANKR